MTPRKYRVRLAKPDRMEALQAWLRAHPRFMRTALFALVGLTFLGAGLGAGSWQSVCRDCPSIAQIYVWEPKIATRILARDGRLIAELFQERRTPVEISSLPAYVPNAFVAVEDRSFYRHDGYSIRGILRAVVVRTPVVGGLLGRRAGGGSTITQQLARHMFTEDIGFEQRPVRKLRELKVALELEDVYTKEQILAAYINQINYGHGWFGIETAAQHYFGKPAVQLTPAEAAMLAAVINRPGAYSPFRNTDLAKSRRDMVLSLMADQGFITEQQAEEGKNEPLPEEPSGQDQASLAPYFVEWVRTMMDDRYGASLYRRGLRIHTTLDIDMQRAAQTAMDTGWARIEATPGYRHVKYPDRNRARTAAASNETPYLQGMFIAMDPHTGEVRALIGGRDFKESKFNRATQALRQPGSTFKPFVFTAAIAGGMPISHVMVDSPFSMPQVDGTLWEPKNYDPGFRGRVNMRETLRHSLNIPTVKLGLDVGLDDVAQYARRMGIRTQIPEYPAISIGSADVIPMQIAEAYSVFATTGFKPTAHPIRRVEDAEGRLLWEQRPQVQQVIDSTSIALVRSLMRDAVDRGTGYPVRDPARGNVPYEIPAGGKTGTTNDATNVWFAGYTPNLLAVVWFGFDRPKTITFRAAGGLFAAPVWGDFMRQVYYSKKPMLQKPAEWAWPSGITTRNIDKQTGKLAGEFCPLDNVYEEYFAAGTEPTDMCDLHGPQLLGRPTATDTLTQSR